TTRPCSSSSRASSTRPRPLPPTSSRTAMPSRLAAARSAHVPPPSNTARAACCTACCSSVRSKFMSHARSSSPPWEAEADGGDDVALHLVHSAAEGVDLGPAPGPLELAAESGAGRAHADIAGGADDAEKGPVDIDHCLGA